MHLAKNSPSDPRLIQIDDDFRSTSGFRWARRTHVRRAVEMPAADSSSTAELPAAKTVAAENARVRRKRSVKCPECGSAIPAEAKRCPECLSDIEPKTAN